MGRNPHYIYFENIRPGRERALRRVRRTVRAPVLELSVAAGRAEAVPSVAPPLMELMLAVEDLTR